MTEFNLRERYTKNLKVALPQSARLRNKYQGYAEFGDSPTSMKKNYFLAAKLAFVSLGVIALAACQPQARGSSQMTPEQRELYAYHEGAVTALEEHLLAGIPLIPAKFNPADEKDHIALIKETRRVVASYTEVLKKIQAELKEGSCKTAQAAYLDLENKELALINSMLDALAVGDGAGAGEVSKTYLDLTASSDSKAIDSAYKTACGVGFV
jgi:hypothetical protein